MGIKPYLIITDNYLLILKSNLIFVKP